MNNLKPRERRHQRTKDAILDAARKIINEKGTNALSIRSIAKAIDYSPAGLYEYFGSKEEIIWAVVQQGFERFTAHLRRADLTLAADEYLVEVGMAYIDFAIQYPDYFLLMFTSAPLTENKPLPEDGDWQKGLLENESFRILYDGVARCVDEGFMQLQAGSGVFELAYISWAQVHGIAMLRITDLGQLPLDYAKIDRLALRALGVGLSKM